MIKQGQKLPQAKLSQITAEGMVEHDTSALFAGKKVVLFAVPGAFTPTCSDTHLPGYIVLADKFQEKGVDLIVCVAVNDAFVMKAWGNTHNASELLMLADGDASFANALGLTMDTKGFGGIRSQRYAMIIEDGVVTLLNVEAANELLVSNAETLLAAL